MDHRLFKQRRCPAGGDGGFVGIVISRSDKVQVLKTKIHHGTGNRADAQGYRVGGKTGSAEKPSEGGYARHSVVATFAAAFPMDNPRYVVIAMVDEPRGNAYSLGQRTAGFTAAPVVRTS